MENKHLFGIVILLAMVSSSCEYNVEDENMPLSNECNIQISYANTIRPLIDSNCMPCHNGDGSEPFAPNLTTYNLVESAALVIKEETQTRRMPKEGSITEAEIEAIRCWVDNGALNN